MRVIAGSLKGRRLKTPSWDGLRPTSDKLRETLFNVLAPWIAGARLLDGYAGTGAVGIEALSRGAAHVTFVERDPRARALITENVAHCGIATACAIIRPSFDRLGQGSPREPFDEPFDIVFLDPPYELRPIDALAAMSAVSELVAPGGRLVLEHARRHGAPPTAGPLVKTRELTSGDSGLSIYERS